MNNEVRDERGVVGYRCYECQRIKPAMWGEICNECREKERRHKELLAANVPNFSVIMAERDQARCERDAIAKERDELRLALRVGREVLAAVIGDIEDGFSLGDMRAKYLNTLLGARDGMDAALLPKEST